GELEHDEHERASTHDAEDEQEHDRSDPESDTGNGAPAADGREHDGDRDEHDDRHDEPVATGPLRARRTTRHEGEGDSTGEQHEENAPEQDVEDGHVRTSFPMPSTLPSRSRMRTSGSRAADSARSSAARARRL